MTNGGQCVMTLGTILMLLWSASSWDMEVCYCMPYMYKQSSKLPVNIHDTCILYCYLTTVCLHSGGTAYSNAHFGAGSGPIFLDDVQCTSSSSQLLECPSRPILSHNCLHSADAGVACEGVFCN